MTNTINPNIIRIDGGTQPRQQLDPSTVEDYTEIILDTPPAQRPNAFTDPIVVYHDGANYWLADGFHRLKAFKNLNTKEIAADIRQGTQRDAILYSAGANANHGLRRTNADKERAVLRLLEDAEWSQWSDREIARRTHTSDQFVGKLRGKLRTQQLQQRLPDADAPEQPRTYQRAGKTQIMNTANIGTTPPQGKPATLPPPPPRPGLTVSMLTITISIKTQPGQSAADDSLTIVTVSRDGKIQDQYTTQYNRLIPKRINQL